MSQSESPLDPAVLTKLREAMEGSGIDLVGELIDMFLLDGPEMVARMRGAFEANDLPRLAHEAHSLKGSVANLGAQRLATLAGDLEVEAQDGGPKVEPLIKQVCGEFERVVEALHAEKAA